MAMETTETYLAALMLEIGFSDADAAFYLTAYNKIKDSSCFEPFARALREFAEKNTVDYTSVRAVCAALAAAEDFSPYTVEMLFYLCLCPYTEALYRARGVSRDIFINTMRDLAYKSEECKLMYGVCGTFVGHWLPQAFTMERFGLGRLQFQFSTFKSERYEKNGIVLKKGDTVLGLHIPRTGTPMDIAGCETSLGMAKVFFADRFDGIIPVTCHSWLLYPPMRNALRPDSNTARFYDMFEIIDWHDNPPGEHPDMWRLFDTQNLDPATLPRAGSLRRVYAERLAAGLPTGSGYGIKLL